MKKNRFIFLLPIVVLMLLIATACAGKGTGEEPAGVTPAANGIESKTAQDTADGAWLTDLKVKEKPAKPDGNVATAATAGAPEEKQGEQEEKTGSSKATVSTKKPGAPVSETQPVPAAGNGKKVSLWVTRDFGRKSILIKTVALQKNWSVFDVLETSTRVTTAHGGAFIDSINGIKSGSGGFGGEKQDWFYYVNGIFADVGALDYYPRPGDVIWWDYHGWERMSMFPAVIGCYPEPFVHGFRGKAGHTTIVSAEGNRKLADNLQKALKAKGVASVTINNLDAGLLKNRQGPTIVLGQWSELSQIDWLANLNKAYTKNGTCVHFTSDGLELLDYRGRVARTIDSSAGVITATGEGSGDESPLWLIVGTDQKGLQQAVDVLVTSPGKISGLYSAAIVAGEVVSLPLE
ncbi:DUF4430 domain-containing protein [Desulfallas sp. Bu1-1]|uniref:DUF4430 domain-containing protein n=1 Tax=Desulfallas sp. Bu1-1 TaxID=2787620 RepID=UPI0018A11F77|nr:DUF4430 domain-containing protein [Desulfallas sp. Bu1-1]MBF7082465.1 DUF4430 domain-containing protein [Desulfallas sp. Bu1-1]